MVDFVTSTRSALQELATRVKTIGPLSSLTTTNKTSVVNAINEVKATSGGGGGSINVQSMKNILSYGAVQGTNEANAAANDAALAAALSGGGFVYIPAGDWCYGITEAKIPNYTVVCGAGQGITRLKMVAASNKTNNGFTNSLNNRLAGSTVNKWIEIRDLSIDANAYNRDGSGEAITTQHSSGCGIAFAGVEHGKIRNVSVTNAWLHAISIDARQYPPMTGSEAYPLGPSKWVDVEDCTVESTTRVDDHFTTHCSWYVRFIRCTAIWNSATPPLYNQNGIELDEGSMYCSAEDCYVRGFSKGYQIKGHPGSPPAWGCTLTRCVAEACNVSFSVEYQTYSNITPVPSKWPAQKATLTDCTSIAPVLLGYPIGGTYSHLDEAKGLMINGYSDVDIYNFRCNYGAHNVISVYSEAKNIRFHNPSLQGCFTDIREGITIGRGGWLQIGSDCGDVIVTNPVAHSPIISSLVVNYSPTNKFVVTDPVADRMSGGNTAALVWLKNGDIQTCVRPKGAGGWYTLTRVDSGAFAGNRTDHIPGETSPNVDWTALTPDSTYFSSGWVKLLRRDGVVYMECIMTRNATGTGTQTAFTIPAGFRSPTFAGEIPDMPMMWAPGSGAAVLRGWQSNAGAIRAVWANSTTYYGCMSWPAGA